MLGLRCRPVYADWKLQCTRRDLAMTLKRQSHGYTSSDDGTVPLLLDFRFWMVVIAGDNPEPEVTKSRHGSKELD